MKAGWALTHDIISKMVLSDVIKQGCEHWEQGDGCIVNILGNAFNLLEWIETAHEYELGYDF